MKTNNIFRKVGGILAEINEHYQYLSESPENLNELELELLSANADFLAEHIKVLKKLVPAAASPVAARAAEPEDESVAETEEYHQSQRGMDIIQDGTDLIKQEFPEEYASFEKPVQNEMPAALSATEEPEEISDVSKAEALVVEEKSQPITPEAQPEEVRAASPSTFFTPEPQPLKEEVPVIAPEAEPPVSKEPEETVVQEVVIEQKTVKVEDPQPVEEPARVPTLNELISAQRATPAPVASQVNQQPVSDLKSIISLNDKLLFIKDLFNGYSLAYSEAIEIINRFDSFDAADNFLKSNYSAKNNWASKQATADKFYELLNRRFS